MSDYFTLSNFGVRYFLEAYTDSNTVPATGTNEMDGVISCTLGEVTKDIKRYKTLNGNGWDVVAALGQSQGDGSFDLVRLGEGDAYDGTAGTSTYTKLKKWFMDSAAEGGSVAPKTIVEVVPRGDGDYEGTVYYVIPNKWGAGRKDTETGQEYNFTVTPFGPQVPVTVTHTVSQGVETWTFAKA